MTASDATPSPPATTACVKTSQHSHSQTRLIAWECCCWMIQQYTMKLCYNFPNHDEQARRVRAVMMIRSRTSGPGRPTRGEGGRGDWRLAWQMAPFSA